MAHIERKGIEAMERKAKVIRNACLREREEARAAQISANAKVRKGWREPDNWGETKLVRMFLVLGEGDEGEIRRSATWSKYVSDGISHCVRAMAGHLRINRIESAAYVMNWVHRIATGHQNEAQS